MLSLVDLFSFLLRLRCLVGAKFLQRRNAVLHAKMLRMALVSRVRKAALINGCAVMLFIVIAATTEDVICFTCGETPDVDGTPVHCGA